MHVNIKGLIAWLQDQAELPQVIGRAACSCTWDFYIHSCQRFAGDRRL